MSRVLLTVLTSHFSLCCSVSLPFSLMMLLVIDDNLGNTMHINKEAQERRKEAEHRRMMELRELQNGSGLDQVQDQHPEDPYQDDLAGGGLNTTVHKPGYLGYSKLSGLGAEVITAPRAYSSAAVLRDMRIKVGADGKIRSMVPSTGGGGGGGGGDGSEQL